MGREVSIQWAPVTSENRFDAVTSGKVDLECGSTTRNAERQKLVSFSPVIFVAGTKLMVPRGSSIKSFKDLKESTWSRPAAPPMWKPLSGFRPASTCN